MFKRVQLRPYRRIVVLTNLLANQLLSPLLGLGLITTRVDSWNNERHVENSSGSERFVLKCLFLLDSCSCEERVYVVFEEEHKVVLKYINLGCLLCHKEANDVPMI